MLFLEDGIIFLPTQSSNQSKQSTHIWFESGNTILL